MSERDEAQINFRVKEEADKEAFTDALAKQPHIVSASYFFQSCMTALCQASDRDELLELPIEFVTKKKR